MKQTASPFTGLTLSGFCMQMSVLLNSEAPLWEGLQAMSEKAAGQREKDILRSIAGKVQAGITLSKAIAEQDCFPPYVVTMTSLGERTGTLDVILLRLSEYYEREASLSEKLQKAIIYPSMMIFILVIILFVLFTTVMPVFSGFSRQIGTTVSSASESIIHLGSILSGTALIAVCILILTVLFLRIMGEFDKKPDLAVSLLDIIKSHSRIARALADRRFCNVMTMTFQCDLDISEGLKMAERLVDVKTAEAAIHRCEKALSSGKSFFEAVKHARLFSAFDTELIRVGSHTGQLEQVMNDLTEYYDNKASEAIDKMTAKLEPAIVSILAISVGLVLLSVMVPLVGILSSIM